MIQPAQYLITLVEGKKVGESPDIEGALKLAEDWVHEHMVESENGTLKEPLKLEIALVIARGTATPKADGKGEVRTTVRMG